MRNYCIHLLVFIPMSTVRGGFEDFVQCNWEAIRLKTLTSLAVLKNIQWKFPLKYYTHCTFMLLYSKYCTIKASTLFVIQTSPTQFWFLWNANHVFRKATFCLGKSGRASFLTNFYWKSLILHPWLTNHSLVLHLLFPPSLIPASMAD